MEASLRLRGRFSGRSTRVMKNLIELFLLAVAASSYPTLLAVVILFLQRERPERLLTYFLAGAVLVSVTIGLIAVLVLDAAGINTSSHPVSAGMCFAFGFLALA